MMKARTGRRPSMATRENALGQVKEIDPCAKGIASIPTTKRKIRRMPSEKYDIDQTSNKPMQIRRNKARAHGRSASELTCSETDVDQLLSEGELT
jgi:hypothetical protein